MNASTETAMVPVPPPPLGEAGQPAPPTAGSGGGNWRWWLAGFGLLLVAAGAFAAFTVRIPYYEFRPGSARPTQPLVEADDVETFDPTSDISFTTVSLRQSTVASYLQAQFDDDIEVVDESVVLGDRSPNENRQFNLQLMDTSKLDAIREALLTLGYEVPISIDGVVISVVREGLPADGVLEPGDTIVAIDGVELLDSTDVGEALAGKGPGSPVTLEVEPPDRSARRTIDLTLGVAPDDPERGVIGVDLIPRTPNYEFPFPIDIDSGNVGGPSAGLAFTLGVIDVLTPGELTGGLQVAVTGTIRADGTVGEVGGVPQKTAVVVGDDYDVFIVPRAEVDQVRARAGDRIRIIGVDTLSEALDALASLGGSGLGPLPGDSQTG